MAQVKKLMAHYSDITKNKLHHIYFQKTAFLIFFNLLCCQNLHAVLSDTKKSALP